MNNPRSGAPPPRAGFTLVEIMIVVVIIGLLAAMALPAIARTRAASQSTRFMSDLRIFTQAFETYAAQNGWPPNAGSGVVPAGMAGEFRAADWTTTKNSIGGRWNWDRNNYGGAAAMMRYLIDCGYSRIAFIGGPAQNFDADERLRGYRETLSSERGAVETMLPGDFSEASGYRAGLDLLARSERPDAIFAANDMMALGCLFALTEHGLHVPDDIALAGFDDVPIARFASPPLTTVRVRIADLGRRAFERLVARIDGDPDEARINEQLACELVVRQSTGKSTRASAGDTS